MRQVCIAVLALLLAVVGSAAQLSLDAAKLSISSIDGSARLSEGFSLSSPPNIHSPTLIAPDEVLRLSFNIKDANGQKLPADRQPHQVVVILSDTADASRVSSSIVNVKRSSGKASWSQRLDRLPSTLLRGSSGHLQVTLLIGSFNDASPVRLPLITVELPAAITQSEGALTLRDRKQIQQGFRRHADHHHTFAVPASEQMPPRITSFVAAAATLVVPWLVLAGLFSAIAPSLKIRSPTPAALPFIASLVALELLALMYWQGFGLTLFKLLPWLLLFSLASILAGRNALTEMRRIRIGKSA